MSGVYSKPLKTNRITVFGRKGRGPDQMKLLSLNVALPRVVEWNSEPVSTGIFKEPVTGPVMLRKLNLDGDRQADLRVHGGVSKAVYAYPIEHYAFWKQEFPGMQLPYGMFGENFSIEGILEDQIRVGDCFRIGDAEIMATEPRLPCYKLGIKFGRPDIIRRFLKSSRTGFYFAVIKEGEVRAGDSLLVSSLEEDSLTIADVTRLYAFDKSNLDLLERAVKLKALSASWRDYFQERLQNLKKRRD